MNRIAAKIGMKSSHFVNATGWPSPDHYTTAHDLALLARALVKNHPEHYNLYSEKYFHYNNINQPNRKPAVVDRPVGRWHQDRSHRRGRLLSGGFGQT
jgi:D-alanyl-D-alanine carboxypeptidase